MLRRDRQLRTVAGCARQTKRTVIQSLTLRQPVTPGLFQNAAHRRHLILQGTLCDALHHSFTNIAFNMPRLKLFHPADLYVLRQNQTLTKPLRQPDAVIHSFVAAARLLRQPLHFLLQYPHTFPLS